MGASSTDLTLVYLTAQRLPASWLAWHRSHLDALGYPVFQVGRASGDLIDDYPTLGYTNVYRQLLRAALVIDTPYLAVAEDDVLYPPAHFALRPKGFAYNQHRWALLTWGPAIYSWRDRVSNCALIAPRALVIEALQERFAKYPETWPTPGELARPFVDRQLGTTVRPAQHWHSHGAGLVQINHSLATEDRQRRRRKALGPVQAFDIPHWGAAADVRAQFLGHA